MPYLVALSILLFSIVAGAQGVPVNLQAAIFFKALAYDYNLQAKSVNELTIVVVTDSKSASQKSALAGGFSKISGQKLGSKTIKVTFVSVSGAGDLEPKVASEDGNIMYIAEGSSDAVLNKMIQIAGKQKIPTLCGSEALVTKGIAIGLTVEDGKPKIIINLAASQKQGMKLSSKLLRISKIIK
jgi:hypothetical protein